VEAGETATVAFMENGLMLLRQMHEDAVLCSIV
jgi:hypothetical protein